MRVSDYTEAPYQGVSQAPAQVRLSTQATAIEDWSIDVPSGAQPRAPFDYVTILAGLLTDDCVGEFIQKAGVGDFIFTLSQESGIQARLYPLLDGTSPVPVTVSPEAQAYLNKGTPSPDDDLRILTVEDYTFVLNRKVTVVNGVTASATRSHEAMVWVRQGAYARTYKVTVTPSGGSPVTCTLTTPNGKDATDGKDVDSSLIASAINGASYPISINGVANGGSVSGSITTASLGGAFAVSLVGEILYITNSSLDFTVTVEDGQGGTALLVIKDRVQSFSDLPKKCPADGFVVRITQQTGAENDDFFVRFRQTAGLGTGVWEETIAPGANLGADPKTLPVALVYNQGAGTWGLDVLAWEPRSVGDAALAPDPGYIGTNLEDITFWKGRLNLIYAEGARLSSATSPLRLYPSTLTQVLADDAVELVNPLTRQANFRYGLPFKTKLILWGTTGQAQVTTGGQPLTPGTANADPYAYYEFSGGVRPQTSNDRIYFAAPRGASATAVYEMEVRPGGSEESSEGDDMSVSVPKYIPAGINRAATCPVQYRTVYGKTGDSAVFSHLYRYADRQRVQNAWSRWNLPAGCTYAGGFFDNTRYYCMVKRGGLVYLLRMDTASGVVDPDSAFAMRLDMRISSMVASRSFSAITGLTTVTLPYPLQSEPRAVVSAPGGIGGEEIEGALLPAPEGTQAELGTWGPGVSVFTLVGDWTQAPLLMGELAVLNKITLSPIIYRDPSGRPNRSGRLVVKKLILDLADTAYLKVSVKIGGRAPRVMTFEASLWDTPGSGYDQVSLYTGEWSVPVGGSANETTIEIFTDSHLPASVLGYSWEGEVNPKAKRIQSQ